MGRITIKDIARALNIHPSTVSRALKDHPDVGTETKAAVVQLAQELGYSPNQQAIHFRHRKSGLIGLILPSINMFFFPSVIQAAEEEALRKGYKLLVFQSGESLEKEKQIAQLCLDFRLEGVLVSLSKESRDLSHFEKLRERDIPVVLFDKVLQGKQLPLVRIGDARAARLAVRHLLSRGYQHLIGLFDNVNLDISQQRYYGFKEAHEQAGLKVRNDWCLFAEEAVDCHKPIVQLLRENPQIDGLFAMSDELLAEAMRVMDQTDRSIPDNFGVVVVSDGRLPYYLQPKVTHIHHSGYEVGRQATALLFTLMEGRTPQRLTIEVPVSLVTLESTRKTS